MTHNTQALPFDVFPDSLMELADYIPKDAIMRLVERYGGGRCYVPKVLPDSSELATVIGLEAARSLAAVRGGEYLEIPRACELRRAVRNREIVRRRREEGLSQKRLALAYGMTERNIRKILKSAAA